MSIGSKIKYLLTKNSLTQLELSKRIGISPVVMNKITKRDSVDARTLYNIARELNVSISYFFDELDDSPVRNTKYTKVTKEIPCRMCIEKDRLVSAQSLIIKLLFQQLDARIGIPADDSRPIFKHEM